MSEERIPKNLSWMIAWDRHIDGFKYWDRKSTMVAKVKWVERNDHGKAS
jgi:hypothetical protein